MEFTDGTTPHGEISFHTLFAKISPAASEEMCGQNLGGCQDTIKSPYSGHLKDIAHLQNS